MCWYGRTCVVSDFGSTCAHLLSFAKCVGLTSSPMSLNSCALNTHTCPSNLQYPEASWCVIIKPAHTDAELFAEWPSDSWPIHLFWPGVTCGITFFDNKLFYYRIRVSVFCPTENYRCFASVCIIICWLMWWVVSRVHAHVHVTVGCTAGWADVIIVLHCCSCTFCQ